MPNRFRSQIRAVGRQPEAEVIRQRIADLALSEAERFAIAQRAGSLVVDLRASSQPGLMESMLAEYGLSDDEGLALMCLAEAYLRVPDTASVDALIRDKIGTGQWSRHAGAARSMLVNASTWGLMLSGEIFRQRPTTHDNALSIVHDLKQRLGEPVVRTGVGVAMRAMGQQFVLGRDIDEAIARSRKARKEGYTHSFDMLGEAARTANAAQRYEASYAHAIARLATAADSKADVFDNPGISVKLSALHPRYETVQRARVMHELVPRVLALARSARAANIGFNIDAEEANRLELSLDVIETVLRDPSLRGWDGFGIVVQAYAKTCLPVLRWFHALTEAIDCRAAVRLVKGAYWDMEIKLAQVLGRPEYPVFTRKQSTDVSWLAGARFLLAHDTRLYPQFASHNAHSIAAVVEMATPANRFEFQRLHGMGENLHASIFEATGRRCRIYAPVGRHKDLLAYLVRRMLENGANSSFVNQMLDESISPQDLVADPVDALLRKSVLANPRIPKPVDLYGAERRNAAGFDVNDTADSAQVDALLAPYLASEWTACPPSGAAATAAADVRNPVDANDVVGTVSALDPAAVPGLLESLHQAQPAWQARRASERADVLDAIANAYEAHMGELMALLTREAGKIRVDAVAEVREAVDFCRYYAAMARAGDALAPACGVFVCISPWNFPLAIFTGQVVAALVTGNAVAAKPADQTPLIAARAVALMHAAGVPQAVLALTPGSGAEVGAALVASPLTDGVCFTGSTATAARIDRALASANPQAPLIAETGGLNAMIVDSTALPESAVRDIVQSAFQSAGQRCSALRVLFVQEDIADELIDMLAGATEELCMGDPRALSVDVGPVIDAVAHARIQAHCDALRARGRWLFGGDARAKDQASGQVFIAPIAFRLERLAELEQEIFGPVLHVIRFESRQLDAVVDDINASGYGLTFGLHSRIDERVERICARIRVGNTYVNRNQIGAVVGVQPFGGERLSGTGPKAGGPHYLSGFVRVPAVLPEAVLTLQPAVSPVAAVAPPSDKPVVAAGLHTGLSALSAAVHAPGAADRVARLHAALGELPAAWRKLAETVFKAGVSQLADHALPGPTGESNLLRAAPRGVALCLGGGEHSFGALLVQTLRALSVGNAVRVAHEAGEEVAAAFVPALRRAGLPADWVMALHPDAVTACVDTLDVPCFVCVEWPDPNWSKLRAVLAGREGARVPLVSASAPPMRWVHERVITVDTTASGGNASLLTAAAAGDPVLT